MTKATRASQRGFGFGEFVLGAFLVVILGITAIRLVPAYMENLKIQNIFQAIAHDPDMQKASPGEIRSSFDRRSSIEDITAIKASDIEISSDGGIPFLSASYAVKIPLGGNVSLYMEFNPTSAE